MKKYAEIMNRIRIPDSERSEILEHVLAESENKCPKPERKRIERTWRRWTVAGVCAAAIAFACVLSLPLMNTLRQPDTIETSVTTALGEQGPTPTPGFIAGVHVAKTSEPASMVPSAPPSASISAFSTSGPISSKEQQSGGQDTTGPVPTSQPTAIRTSPLEPEPDPVVSPPPLTSGDSTAPGGGSESAEGIPESTLSPEPLPGPPEGPSDLPHPDPTTAPTSEHTSAPASSSQPEMTDGPPVATPMPAPSPTVPSASPSPCPTPLPSTEPPSVVPEEPDAPESSGTTLPNETTHGVSARQRKALSIVQPSSSSTRMA